MPSTQAVPVIGVGGSAGGLVALKQFVEALPGDLHAAVLVVLHLSPHTPSQLDLILASTTGMSVTRAEDGERIKPGHIYVARSDRHLMLDGDRMRLSRGPKECRVRPAIDVLFRSLASSCGPRAAGVILSGMLDDGTAGLWAVKQSQGRAYVQDPAEALHPSMPESAAEHVDVDLVAPVAVLAREVAAWSSHPADPAPSTDDRDEESHRLETRIAGEENALRIGVMDLGRQSRYACPDCHGALLEIREGRVVRFRCHTGHAFSIQTLLAEIDTSIDNGLWSTVRAMEERLLLLRELARLAAEGGRASVADHYRRQAGELEKPIDALRRMVLDEHALGHASEG
jgi:two-component system, chemotaxis family, protein-glutamate methylesterase/glutaminase